LIIIFLSIEEISFIYEHLNLNESQRTKSFHSPKYVLTKELTSANPIYMN